MANEAKTGEAGQTPTEAGNVVKVPTATLCRLFGISDVHLGKLAAAGHVFRAGIGQYDLWASVRGYIGFLQKRAESGRKAPQKHTLSLAEAKIQETRERSERLALRNAEARGELVSIRQIVRAFGNIFSAMRERILSSDLTDAEKDLLLGDLRGLLEAEALTHERNHAGHGRGPSGAGPVPSASAKDDLSAMG